MFTLWETVESNMTYNIDCFTCTVQGIIAIETQDRTLSKDELSILQFVNSYNHSYNKETLQKIESRFRQIYESVNLTRLVVLKYLEIKNQTNSGLFANDLLSALSKSERFVVQRAQQTHMPNATSPTSHLETSDIPDIPASIPDTENTGANMANAHMPAAPEVEDAWQINASMSAVYNKDRFESQRNPKMADEIDPILNLINGKMNSDINDELLMAV